MRKIETLFHFPSYISAVLVPGDNIDSKSPLIRSFGMLHATAISELLEFANRFVLDDRVVIYGPNADLAGQRSEHDMGRFVEFLRDEIERTDSIVEIPPKDFRFPMNIWRRGTTPLPESNGDIAQWIFEELGQSHLFDKSDEYIFPSRREVRTLHLTMFLSDYMSYDFAAQSMAAPLALSTYPTFLAELKRAVANRQPFHPEFDAFQKHFEEAMRAPVSHGQAQYLNSPSFLLEALRQSERPEGVFHVLRAFRDSPAATRYRELNRTRHYGKGAKEREEARRELESNVDSFKAEGLKSRVPQWLISGISLSTAACALLYPGVAPAAALAIPALITADYARQRWLGSRRNLFTDFSTDEGDLYTEFNRVWGPLYCTREQLAKILEERKKGNEKT